ncbi:CoA-binding protein [Sphingomonas crocodyli]|uniref:CoA-binding protein n=1 Tax=Sphingomonas crocodyli TaxID=1979270 RepID=A0A437LUS7_9SPHN|nr:CoA-binding protein [Sphingomonas crocodyli]
MPTPNRPEPPLTSVDADARIRANFAKMLRAKRVAVLGASARNQFSAPVIANLDRLGFTGHVQLVNPKGEPIGDRPVLRSIADLEGPVDAAFVCVPQSAVIDTVAEAAAAGVTGFVVVSSGFAEAGAEGRALQDRLAAVAREHQVALLGPNGLGFINYVDRVPMCVLGRPVRTGGLGIASVSGSVGGYLTKVAMLQGVGVSHMILTGNEAGITIADVVDFLVDDPDTTSIAVFLEAIYDPRRFAAAAERALKARKPIVVLKAGASEATARLAAAHTGALLGDDRVFDAVAAELGLSRVYSYEDLIATAALLGQVGPVAKPGVAALTVSGGSGEILSDLAGAAGVAFPPFSPDVQAALEATVSAFGQTHNPLDLTGAALADPLLWERCLTAIAADETIGLTLCLWDPPIGPTEGWIKTSLESIARGYAAYPATPPLVALVAEPMTDYGHDALRDAGIPGAIAGLKPAVTALAQLAPWSGRVLEDRPVSLFADIGDGTDRPRHDRALLDRLGELGAPVVPGTIVEDAEAAVRVAEGFGYPVALKLVAPDLQHKTEVGGVRLNLADADAIHEAFAALSAIDQEGIEGIAVSPMRKLDAELLVAISHDPSWGPVLTLGLGGIWVEVMDDVRLLPLPADARRIEAALRSLRGAPLLTGARGRPPVDLAAASQAIERIAAAALALGPDLSLLEINPLGISGEGAEALDALALWKA